MLNGFSERLRKLREGRKPVLSMRVTSELMGLHKDALRRYERGEAVPGAEVLVMIAAYYGVSVDYLLGLEK